MKNQENILKVATNELKPKNNDSSIPVIDERDLLLEVRFTEAVISEENLKEKEVINELLLMI